MDTIYVDTYDISEINSHIFQKALIIGTPAILTTDKFINKCSAEDFYMYELEVDAYGFPIKVAKEIHHNFAGTIITRKPLKLNHLGYLTLHQGDVVGLGGRVNFSDFIAGIETKNEYPSLTIEEVEEQRKGD